MQQALLRTFCVSLLVYRYLLIASLVYTEVQACSVLVLCSRHAHHCKNKFALVTDNKLMYETFVYISP